ncbi:hypothetical protein [Streptomyces sp. NPDC093109]|uniref:hypothetical protein n=1 Tax=Streptomyces sp. NPDC093109 TaxID=3154977 RepID=UPI00344F6CD5
MISTDGNGGGGIGDDGFSLAEALGGLSTGAEPPMPDLVPGAIERGVRIRRRRRIGTALGSAAVAATFLTGGYAVVLPMLAGGNTTASPANPGTTREDAVVYPSLEVLRSVVHPKTGTVEAASPKLPVRPGQYFLLTTPGGATHELYVSITRTAAAPKALELKSAKGDPLCPASAEDAYATGWNSLLRECSFKPWKLGPVLLYAVVAEPPSAKADIQSRSATATGATYMTPDGWTVQVIAGALDGSRAGQDQALTSDQLCDLATNPTLLDAVKDD